LGDSALAQITPDTTLGSENSTVTSTGAVDQINGGATRGANLFHSFQEFNVDEGRAAFFTNPAGIENILSRVAGANPSNILGTLGVSGGNANLFLINPNGIIFGPNASLDVRGSFVATTAHAIRVGDQGFFSASAPNQPELLTVNPSAFFFNQIAAGSIANQSVKGLQVPAGQSLLLLGGDVKLDDGKLTAPGGRVELGGLARSGTVGLNVDDNNLRLAFPLGAQLSDILLTNGSVVDVTAGGGGSIAVNARNLDIFRLSSLLAGIGAGLGSVGTQAGNIEIDVTDTVTISGVGSGFPSSRIINLVNTGALGNAGNIVINTGSLNVIDNAVIGSATFGRGNTGSITIQARDTVSLSGSSNTGVSSAVAKSGVGNGSDINIQTRSLSLSGGAQLGTGTLGQGNSGNVQVNASDFISVSGGSVLQAVTGGQGNAGNVFIQAGGKVSFDGENTDTGVPSTATSLVGPQAIGSGGNINIQARSLSLTNGARISADTEGQGNAGSVSVWVNDSISLANSSISTVVQSSARGQGGDITVKAESLSLTGRVVGSFAGGTPGGLFTFTRGVGDAGNITIDTRHLLVQEAAAVSVETRNTGDAGDLKINTEQLLLRDGANVSASTRSEGQGGAIDVTALESVEVEGSSDLIAITTAVGDARDLKITTEQMTVKDKAEVAVSSQGSGKAGNLEVTARSISLDKEALLSSDTTAGQGNIFLDSQNLVLRRGSNITTKAFGTAIGGNITIDSGVLVALEDSNISANALDAFGGRVIIDSQGIFRTEDNDITATSRLGPEFSGDVEINTPDVDPSRGLVDLPAVPIDTEVAQACTPGGSQAQSKFVITGRGGLPPSPNDALSSDAIQVDWVTLNPRGENRSSPTVSTNPTAPAPIVEAQGWVIDKNGQVVLTASAPTATPHSSWQTSADCHDS
jgi:filamentous hemagglutinin family protein